MNKWVIQFPTCQFSPHPQPARYLLLFLRKQMLDAQQIHWRGGIGPLTCQPAQWAKVTEIQVNKFTLMVATKIRRSATNSGLTSSAPMFTSHNCVAELYSWWVCLPHPLRGCSGCLMQEIGQASAEARITNCWQTQCREECVACQLNFSFTINVHLAANPRETSDALLLFFF